MAPARVKSSADTSGDNAGFFGGLFGPRAEQPQKQLTWAASAGAGVDAAAGVPAHLMSALEEVVLQFRLTHEAQPGERILALTPAQGMPPGTPRLVEVVMGGKTAMKAGEVYSVLDEQRSVGIALLLTPCPIARRRAIGRGWIESPTAGPPRRGVHLETL